VHAHADRVDRCAAPLRAGCCRSAGEGRARADRRRHGPGEPRYPPGFRFAHAKGLVLTGSFTPAPSARTISRAAHLTGGPVPVTVRMSDGTGLRR